MLVLVTKKYCIFIDFFSVNFTVHVCASPALMRPQKGKGTSILNCAYPKMIFQFCWPLSKPNSLSQRHGLTVTLYRLLQLRKGKLTLDRTRLWRVQRKREHTHTSSNTVAYAKSKAKFTNTAQRERDNWTVQNGALPRMFTALLEGGLH